MENNSELPGVHKNQPKGFKNRGSWMWKTRVKKSEKEKEKEEKVRSLHFEIFLKLPGFLPFYFLLGLILQITLP